MHIGSLPDIADEALIIKRFDREADGRKIHFEEFNQLLNLPSEAKYDGSYEDMASFITNKPDCIPIDAERLFRRILASLLLGSTDAHLKNFAMFHTDEGLRLTPGYDVVAGSYYKDYQTIALQLAGAENLKIGELQAKHVVGLGQGFGLPERAIQLAIKDLEGGLEKTKDAVNEADAGSAALRDAIINIMEKRWNGTFALIGNLLSKRRAGGEKS